MDSSMRRIIVGTTTAGLVAGAVVATGITATDPLPGKVATANASTPLEVAQALAAEPPDTEGLATPITGDALSRASAAALAATGGGKVTDTEVRDEEGYYQVEVTRPDGDRVDAQLDRQFSVLAAKADGRGTDDKNPR